MLPTLPHLPLKLLLPQPLPPLLLLKLNKTARAKTGDNFSGLPSLSQPCLVNTRHLLFTVIKENFLIAPPVLREVFLLQIFPSMCTFPRSQIHFIRLLSREAHISVKKLAMGLGIKRILWQEHLLQVRYVTAGGNSCDC